MQKPDGLIGLLPSQLPRAIAHLALRDLPGVGARTEARLNAKGITTMEQLLALDRNGMHGLWDSVWGDRPVPLAARRGNRRRRRAGGKQCAEIAWPLARDGTGVSLGRRRLAVAHKLLHKAAMRLRMEKFYTGSLSVTVKYALTRDQVARSARAGAKTKKHTSGIEHTAWGMEARFRDAQDTLSLLDVLRKTWAKRPQGEQYARPFFVGVTLRALIPENEHQADLFGDPDNRAGLSATMDKLNLKYGHTTLHFAGMLPARETAPTRIAFTQIPVQYGVEYM